MFEIFGDTDTSLPQIDVEDCESREEGKEPDPGELQHLVYLEFR